MDQLDLADRWERAVHRARLGLIAILVFSTLQMEFARLAPTNLPMLNTRLTAMYMLRTNVAGFAVGVIAELVITVP